MTIKKKQDATSLWTLKRLDDQPGRNVQTSSQDCLGIRLLHWKFKQLAGFGWLRYLQ